MTIYENIKKYIPVKDLEKGATYFCLARNFTYGVWTGDQFRYIRHKFTGIFIDYETHYDDDPRYGTVMPLAKLEFFMKDYIKK